MYSGLRSKSDLTRPVDARYDYLLGLYRFPPRGQTALRGVPKGTYPNTSLCSLRSLQSNRTADSNTTASISQEREIDPGGDGVRKTAGHAPALKHCKRRVTLARSLAIEVGFADEIAMLSIFPLLNPVADPVTSVIDE